MKHIKHLISALLLFVAAILAFLGDAIAASICFLVASGYYSYTYIQKRTNSSAKD